MHTIAGFTSNTTRHARRRQCHLRAEPLSPTCSCEYWQSFASLPRRWSAADGRPRPSAHRPGDRRDPRPRLSPLPPPLSSASCATAPSPQPSRPRRSPGIRYSPTAASTSPRPMAARSSPSVLPPTRPGRSRPTPSRYSPAGETLQCHRPCRADGFAPQRVIGTGADSDQVRDRGHDDQHQCADPDDVHLAAGSDSWRKRVCCQRSLASQSDPVGAQ
jgi:hypothetical protein